MCKSDAPVDFDIFDDVSSDDPSWSSWRTLVVEEQWRSDDRSVLELTPKLDSTRCVVAKDKDGNWIGSVVWNEYDNVAFIGFYLMSPAYRGKGVGSILWKRAISRMPSNYSIGLRAVESMAAKYQSTTTPVETDRVDSYLADGTKLHEIIQPYVKHDSTVRVVKNLTKEDYRKMEIFDQRVTKRDRREFLQLYNALPYTMSCCIFNGEGDVTAMASITPTGKDEEHVFKISPIYASSLEDAFTVIRPLVDYATQMYEDAKIHCHLMSGTRGCEVLAPIFQKANVPHKLSGITLFSKKYSNPLDTSMVFIPNNNSGHFDA